MKKYIRVPLENRQSVCPHCGLLNNHGIPFSVCEHCVKLTVKGIVFYEIEEKYLFDSSDISNITSYDGKYGYPEKE